MKNHAFIPTISALGLDVSDYYHNIIGDNNLLSKTEFDYLYYPGEPIKSQNQEHVWVSLQTANNVLDELMPETLEITGENWQQGEIVAKTRVHFKTGFSASSSDELHAYLGNIDKTLLAHPEEQWGSNRSNRNKNKINNNVNVSKVADNYQAVIYPNPSTGIFTIFNSEKIINIRVIDLTGKIIFHSNINSKKKEIDISTSPNGIYIVKIQTENKVITNKIMKR